VDDLSVFEVEADLIRESHGHLLSHGIPHASSGCAFLSDDGSCRIYDQRPYVCRTQGLPLRWMLDAQTEQRDICPLNEEGAVAEDSLELLHADDCWTLGPFETRLASLELSRIIPRVRVLLRSLFVLPAA
jgi:uncharacterized protein